MQKARKRGRKRRWMLSKGGGGFDSNITLASVLWAGSLLAPWGSGGQQPWTSPEILFPEIAGSRSIPFLSKPPATRGRECHIFLASFVRGDVFNEGIHRGFQAVPKVPLTPSLLLGTFITAPEIWLSLQTLWEMFSDPCPCFTPCTFCRASLL